MDTRYLKSLLAVVERGSIADAARSEGLTPAAVGQRIQALERELGVELLNRAGHTVRPTEACFRLVPRARRIVNDAEDLADDGDIAGLTGVLRMGAISTALTGLMPKSLRQLQLRAPGIRPHITPGMSTDLYGAVLKEELDAVLIVEPPFEAPKSLVVNVLKSEPLVLLSKTPLAESVPEALIANPYIRYDPKAWGGRLAEKYCQETKIEPVPFCDLDALETIALLVAEDMGVSLVPHWLGMERYKGQISLSPPLPTVFDRKICLVTHATPRRAAMIDALSKAVQDEIRKVTASAF